MEKKIELETRWRPMETYWRLMETYGDLWRLDFKLMEKT